MQCAVALNATAASYMGASFPTPFAHFDPSATALLQASYHGLQQHNTPLGTTYYAPPFFYWPYSSPPVSPTTCYNHPAAAAVSPPLPTAYHQAMYSLDLISAQINFASQTAGTGAALNPPAVSLQLQTPAVAPVPPPITTMATATTMATTNTASTLSPQVAQAQTPISTQTMPVSKAAIKAHTLVNSLPLPQAVPPCHENAIAYVQQEEPVAAQPKAQIMTLLQFKQFSTPTVTPTVAVIPTISATTPNSNNKIIITNSTTTTTITTSTTSANTNTAEIPVVKTMEACAQTENQQPQSHQKYKYTCQEKSLANIGNSSNINKNNNNNDNNILLESEGRCKDMPTSDMLTIDTLDAHALNSNSSNIITETSTTPTTTTPAPTSTSSTTTTTQSTFSIPTHKHIAPLTGRAKHKVNKVC